MWIWRLVREPGLWKCLLKKVNWWRAELLLLLGIDLRARLGLHWVRDTLLLLAIALGEASCRQE